MGSDRAPLTGVAELRRRHRTHLFWSIGAGLVAGAAAFGLWSSFTPAGRPGSPPASLVGKPAPDFQLARLAQTGGTLALRDLRGRPAVLNFWASWCGPCEQETPLLVRVYQRYRGSGVAFVGVDTNDDRAAAVAFALRHHIDYPTVYAPGERLALEYHIIGLPTTVFVDGNGVVRDEQVGGFSDAAGERDLAARLNRLLGEPR
jgi:cytochrome c biogenesis protein CcmG/thiol:disulfide interchange protein DsbE